MRAINSGQGHTTLALTDLVPAETFAGMEQALSLRVMSWSMYPAIRKGDLLELASPEEIQVGDIVVFRHIGALVCHRIARVEPGNVVYTRGDYSKGDGEQIRGTDILGKVIAIVRGRCRLSPPDPRESSGVVPICMRVDQWKERARERGLSVATRCLTAITRNKRLRDLLWSGISPMVRFSVAYPAPVRAVRAYQVVEMGGLPIASTSFYALPSACRHEEDLFLVARLDRFALGSLNLASGEIQVGRVASSLYLEEQLRAIGRQLRDWQQSG